MHESVSIICLTATAYAGVEQGLEKSIIDQMSQSIYYNSSEKADFIPRIHEEDDFGSFDDYCKMISEERKKCGVLVYATGELYDKLIVENIGGGSQSSHELQAPRNNGLEDWRSIPYLHYQ